MNPWTFESWVQPSEHRGNKSRKHVDLFDNDNFWWNVTSFCKYVKECAIEPERNTLKLTLCSVGTESESINKGGRMNECVNFTKRNDSASFSTA